MKKSLVLVSMLFISFTQSVFAGGSTMTCCRCSDGSTVWHTSTACSIACAGGTIENAYTDQTSCLAASCSTSTQNCEAKISSIGCN